MRLILPWLFALILAGTESAQATGDALASAAAAQIGITTGYDGSYRQLAYPGGDVSAATGVCSDVVIRALRQLGVDLQVAVHDDMRAHFDAYPDNWGLQRTDRNIDHRRVPNLETFLHRKGWAVAADAAKFEPGDIVSWRLDSGLPHIGILSSRRVDGRPLVIHNIGAGTQEEDVLHAWRKVGHYRMPADPP
ncbi:MAG: DUF1287 domain-containing protein [Pseudomarimonas sp.]